MNTNTLTIAQAGIERTHRTMLGKLGAFAGIGFSILFVVIMFLMGSGIPGGTDTNQDIARYYTEQNRLTNGTVILYGLVATGALFLWFLAALCSRLRHADEEPTGLSSIAFGSGLIFVAVVLVAAAAVGSIAFSVELGEETQVQPVVASLGWLAGMLLLIPAMVAVSITILATSILSLRTGVLPRWLAWLGIGCSVLLVGLGWMYMPVIALPIWAVAASIALLRQRPAD